MLRQRLGKRAPALDGKRELAEDLLKRGERSCFSSTRNPRRSGRPASTSVASCRVNVVNTFGCTRPLNPGILMLRFTFRPPPFLPPPFMAGLAFFAAALLRTFSASTILVG